jgi:protein SCO1
MKSFYFILFLLLITNCSEEKTEIQKESNKLPFIGHVDVISTEENGQKIIDTIFETIPYFSFLNQDSIEVNKSTYKDKILVAEFFFASCPTICPLMNTQMSELYSWLQKNNYLDHFQILSFSIDPINDTPSALKKFKAGYCERCSNWDFLTGDEKETHSLGIDGFKVFAGKDEGAAGGYAHSGAFSLVDKKERVRGVYNITDENGDVNKKEFDRLKKEIEKLMRYEYNLK